MNYSFKQFRTDLGKSSSAKWKFWKRDEPSSASPGPAAQSAPRNGASAPDSGAPANGAGPANGARPANGAGPVNGARSGNSAQNVAFRIEHWTRGRLRVKIERLARDQEYAARLEQRVAVAGFARRASVRQAAMSLVIEYDTDAYEEPEILEYVVLCIRDAANPNWALPVHSPTTALAAAAPTEESPKKGEEGDEFKIDYVKRMALPGAAMLMTLGVIGGVAVPPLLLGGTLLAAAVPSFKRAWAGIRDEKKLNVDFLDSTAIIALTGYSIFFPPALMVTLIETGEIIRDLTARRTARANLDLIDALGSVARVERDGIEVEVPLQEVVVGDIVVVYPGDQIPVDGVVLSGTGIVDQQKLTGESIPITREEGQDVLAATLLVDGVLRIEARRTGENTRAGVVVALMKAAPVHDTRMENYARKVGDRIVIPTLALGGAVTLLTANPIAGVSIITLDIGTGIRVSVPTAILASLTFAARNGILIRSGRALEQLAQVDTVVFDKTGTLTQGHAGVVGIYTQEEGAEPAVVLQLAASAEQGLTHPVAEAITRHARELDASLLECETWEYRVGQGVAATIEGRMIYVGSHRMMANLGVDTETINARHPEIEASAASQVYVATDDGLLGVILYKDPVRPETPGVIANLHELRMTPYMLSGDVKSVADAIAAEVGIGPEQVYAEAFPERKVEVVKGLQESGKVIAFVGDGINDSAALAHASVSVSFAGATDMARETADIVLMDDDLSDLILAIRIARMSIAVVKQNTGIIVGPNLGAMVYAALIGLNPAAAVVVNNGSAIVAEMNGFRPLLGPPGWEKLVAERRAAVARLEAKQFPVAQLPEQAALPSGENGHEPARVAANGAAPLVGIEKGESPIRGQTNGNGHANGNGQTNGNGHSSGNGKMAASTTGDTLTVQNPKQRSRRPKKEVEGNDVVVENGANGKAPGSRGSTKGARNGASPADGSAPAETQAPAARRTRAATSARATSAVVDVVTTIE